MNKVLVFRGLAEIENECFFKPSQVFSIHMKPKYKEI
jgi:hypothetical protein